MKSRMLGNLLYALCMSGGLLFSTHLSAHNNDAKLGIEATGGWYRDTAAGTPYGVQALSTVTLPPSGTLLRITPKHKFGGKLGVCYHFANSPYHVALAYGRVHSDSSDFATGPIGATKIPANFGVDFSSSAGSSLEFSSNMWHLKLGSDFHPNDFVTISPHLGLSHLRARNDQDTTYSPPFIGGGVAAFNIFVEEASSFRGFGPTFGVDLDMATPYEPLGLFGGFNYGAYVGTLRSNYSLFQPGGPLATLSVDSNARHSIVSMFKTELGLSYLFCPNYNGKIKVGYAISKAIDATEDGNTFVDDVGDSAFINKLGNLGFSGPFLRLSLDWPI